MGRRKYDRLNRGRIDLFCPKDASFEGMIMSKIKKTLLDTSLFRRAYMICLVCTNISLVLIPMYVLQVLMFVWGVFLVIYNEIKYRTIRRTRYGLWLVALVLATLIAGVIHISCAVLPNLYNLVMVLNVAICFFVYYSVHTEKELNFRRELYSFCKFMVYLTTVLGILGLAFLLADIRFEVFIFKFIIYENRFDGMFVNPNVLGLLSVIAIFCCHMLLKKDFIAISGRERVSRIWIGSCVAVNAISLLLCDSNGALVLMIGYAIFFVIYKMFGSESKFSKKQIITKSASCLVAGAVIVTSLFFVRTMTQQGFQQLMNAMPPSHQLIDEDMMDQLIMDEAMITFEHENTNVDSGRFTLWEQAVTMYAHHPVLGIGKGNIYYYGRELFENGVKFSEDYGDLGPFLTEFHNAYLTVLVSSGAVGFLFFVIFGVRFFTHITKHVFRDDSLKESILPCMYAFLCSYVIYSFLEVGLLYNVTIAVFIFWMILGYTSCFLVKYEPDEDFGTFRLFKRDLPKTLL